MRTLIISLKIFLFLSILTGVIYPLLVTVTAQIIFPFKANGSLINKNNKVIGSELIGQKFDSITYFTSRPSSISYNPLPSGGSNYGLTSSKLKQLVEARKLKFITFNQLDSLADVPSEMVFASASGLDPHISQKAALLQVNRISQARNFDSSQKQELVECVKKLTEHPQFNFLGQERINVLILNIELEKLDNTRSKK